MGDRPNWTSVWDAHMFRDPVHGRQTWLDDAAKKGEGEGGLASSRSAAQNWIEYSSEAAALAEYSEGYFPKNIIQFLELKNKEIYFWKKDPLFDQELAIISSWQKLGLWTMCWGKLNKIGQDGIFMVDFCF